MRGADDFTQTVDLQGVEFIRLQRQPHQIVRGVGCHQPGKSHNQATDNKRAIQERTKRLDQQIRWRRPCTGCDPNGDASDDNQERDFGQPVARCAAMTLLGLCEPGGGNTGHNDRYHTQGKDHRHVATGQRWRQTANKGEQHGIHTDDQHRNQHWAQDGCQPQLIIGCAPL